jgi:hypothetical protein
MYNLYRELISFLSPTKARYLGLLAIAHEPMKGWIQRNQKPRCFASFGYFIRSGITR